jgi:hypothetical protein
MSPDDIHSFLHYSKFRFAFKQNETSGKHSKFENNAAEDAIFVAPTACQTLGTYHPNIKGIFGCYKPDEFR